MTRTGLIALVAALAAGCSGDDNPSQPSGNTGFSVAVVNNQFNPSTIDVPVGSTVTWQWNSSGVTHNVRFQDGTTSGDKSSGSFPRTFQAAGNFPYICTIHGAEGMSGVVNVTASSGGGGGGGGSGGGGGGAYP